MKILDYLKDRIVFIIFYLSFMIFLCVTIFIDAINGVLSTNILYIISVSTIFFLITLIIDYIKIKDFTFQLKKRVKNKVKFEATLIKGS